MLELSSIEGVPEEVRRRVGLNLTGGDTNAVEFCTKVYKAPTLPTLLDGFKREIGAAA